MVSFMFTGGRSERPMLEPEVVCRPPRGIEPLVRGVPFPIAHPHLLRDFASVAALDSSPLELGVFYN